MTQRGVSQSGLDELVSRNDLAARLGVQVSTLKRWDPHGCAPPPVRIGRQVFYRAVTVRKWIEARERTGSVKS